MFVNLYELGQLSVQEEKNTGFRQRFLRKFQTSKVLVFGSIKLNIDKKL